MRTRYYCYCCLLVIVSFMDTPNNEPAWLPSEAINDRVLLVCICLKNLLDAISVGIQEQYSDSCCEGSVPNLFSHLVRARAQHSRSLGMGAKPNIHDWTHADHFTNDAISRVVSFPVFIFQFGTSLKTLTCV